MMQMLLTDLDIERLMRSTLSYLRVNSKNDERASLWTSLLLPKSAVFS